MKKILIVTLILGLTFSCLPNELVFAKDLLNDEKSFDSKSGVSTLFTEFLDECFLNLDGVQVIDVNGLDVTEQFINEVSSKYFLGDYKTIQELIAIENLLVSYEKITYEKNLESNYEIMGIREEIADKTFYHIEWDSNKKFQGEWTSTLIGKYLYNCNTKRIISASSPTITFDSHFGSAFSPEFNNINTDYSLSKSGTRLTFKGSYDVNSTLDIPVGDFEIGYPINFGSFRDVFDV